MTLINLLIAILVMTVAALAWVAMHYYLNPRIENPDGSAKFTGSCGDTMELTFSFDGPRVADIWYWTDGCAISKMCIATAAALVKGSTAEELLKIDRSMILEKVGELPDTHYHCAVLAETVVQMAVDKYITSCTTTAFGRKRPPDRRNA
jgi:nitrogen fixation NifU-like protein